MQEQQQTLKQAVRYSGLALHTGVRAHVTLRPAPADSGITLVRSDLPGQPQGRAAAANVRDVRRATTLGCGASCVHTVEHVLAALWALGVDNALIEMDGPEPPIADGSAGPYVELIQQAGLEPQAAPRQYCTIRTPLIHEAGETRLVIIPSPEYRISCTVDFGHCLLDCQYLSLAITPESFVTELSRARTFCAYAEIEGLMVAGLIRGGSLDNAVVIKDGAIVSKDGLRYPREFVRHKILDLVGDLALVGRRLRGQVIAIKPGHQANVALAQQIVQVMAQEQEHGT